MTEVQRLEAKISALAISDAHTCRDDGYSSGEGRCPVCCSQVSHLSVLAHLRRSRTK